MKFFFPIVILEILSLSILSEAGYGMPRRKCDPFDPPVRRNVHIDNLKGRWFHGINILPKSLPFKLLRIDYNYDIMPGGIAIINGRPWKIDAELCVYETVQFKKLLKERTPTFTFTSYWKWFGRKMNLRILDTDYRTYAIFWVCSQITDGKCTDFFTLIGTKDAAGLSQKQLLKLNPILKRTICASVSDFINWPLRPEKVCPRKDIFNVKVVNNPTNGLSVCQHGLQETIKKYN